MDALCNSSQSLVIFSSPSAGAGNGGNASKESSPCGSKGVPSPPQSMEHDQSPTEGGGRSEDPPTGKRVGESAEDKTKVTVIQIVPSHNRHPNANQQEKTHRYFNCKSVIDLSLWANGH